MQKFKSFVMVSEEHQLTEALNTPVEYYMTDDTKMPESIYAAFEIDGGNYIMSLVQTEDKGVYLFEVGKTSSSGGKTLWWRFHDKSHMLPVMATAMNFLQASTAWMQGKVNGIAIHFKMGAAANAERAQRIAQRIIKRAYVKSFNVIPVSQPPLTDKDKYYYQKMRYVFIAKKSVSPSTLFGGKTFKKYDIEGGEAPIEAVSQLEPKKKKKATNTLKPSKKYSFGQYDVDTPLDDELLDKVTDIKKVEAGSSQKEKKAPPEYINALNNAAGGGLNSKAGMVMAMPSMLSMVKALQKYGYDESKLDWTNLDYVVTNKASGAEKAMLKEANLLPVSSSKGLWVSVMKKIATPSSSANVKSIVSSAEKAAIKFMADYPQGGDYDASPSTTKMATVIKSNINPEELQATLPGSGTDVQVSGPVFEVKGEDPGAKAQHLSEQLGYGSQIKSTTGFQQLKSYSGSSYDSYNTTMRQVVKSLLEGQKQDSYMINQVLKNTGKYQKLAKMFDKVDPIPESFWVYRGTTLPNKLKDEMEPGYQFVDPAFLSTSVSPGVSMGKDKMRIFLPKGSKVLPVLYNSQHKSEKEVLLPPASVVKVIEVLKNDNNTIFFQGVFMGSSWKSISEALKNKLTESINHGNMRSIMETIRLMEKLENQKYNPADKFGGEYDDELAELIQQEIEKGNFEIEEPEQSDD